MKTLSLHHILVPTDLSLAGIDALRYARLFAERFHARLTLFSVDPIVFPTEGLGVRGSMPGPDALAHHEREVRLYAAAALHGVDYAVTTAAGQPVPLIVREAADAQADLLVMSTQGLGGWRRAILGSVTQDVLHRGNVPILSLRRSAGSREAIGIRKIACPINYSEVAADALDDAAALAKAFDAELLVVHVVEEGEAGQPDALRAWVDDKIRTSYREVVLRGGAAERVLDFAEDTGADLLVIGAQHKLFRDETVIGSTTERLVRFAHMPVLSIPRPVSALPEARLADELATTVR